MDGSPAPRKTSRLGMTDSPPVESAPYCFSVHQRVVRDVLHQGVGQNLVSTFPLSAYDVG